MKNRVIVLVIFISLVIGMIPSTANEYAFFLCRPEQYQPAVLVGPQGASHGNALNGWWLNNDDFGSYSSGWFAFKFSSPVKFTGLTFAMWAKNVEVDYILYKYDNISVPTSIKGKELFKQSVKYTGDPNTVQISLGEREPGDYVFCIVNKGLNGAMVKNENYVCIGAAEKRPGVVVDIAYSEMCYSASYNNISKFKHTVAAYVTTVEEVTEEMLATPEPTATPTPTATPDVTPESTPETPDKTATAKIVEITPTAKIIEATYAPEGINVKKSFPNYVVMFAYGILAGLLVVFAYKIINKRSS